MSLSPKQIKVGGQLLSTLLPVDGYWGDLSWVHRRVGGFYSAQFNLLVPAGWRHPAIIRGARVELWDGGYRFAIGSLSDLDWGEGAFQVAGLCQIAMGQDAPLALDGTLAPAGPYTTTTPNVAVDEAIARGALPGWSRNDDIGSSPLVVGDLADADNTVGQVVDGASAIDGRPWRLDRNGVIALVADSTTPDYHIYPGQIELGVADDEYASHVYVSYVDSATLTVRRVVAIDEEAAKKWGRVELPVSLTDRGSTDAGTAQAIADGILVGARRRPTWIDPIEVSADQLRLNGGMSADLDSVEGGQMIRAHGLVDERTGESSVDIVIDEVQRADGAPTIVLLPVGLAARTLSAVIEEVTKAASFVPLAS